MILDCNGANFGILAYYEIDDSGKRMIVDVPEYEWDLACDPYSQIFNEGNEFWEIRNPT